MDHAAFMLAETETQIATVHFTKSVSKPIESPASEPTTELEKWKETTEGKKMKPFLEEARWMIEQAGIQAERHKIAILPSKGKIHAEILSYCQQQKIGIVILGHREGGGTWGFLKSSITEKILGDFKNKRYLIAIALTLQAGGVFIFSFVDMNKWWLIIPFLLFYAPGYGGPIPLRPALLADYFGTSNFGTIFGLMMLIGMMGGMVGPVFAGWVFDTTGSYQLAFQIVALTTIVAIPLILLAKPPRAKQEP